MVKNNVFKVLCLCSLVFTCAFLAQLPALADNLKAVQLTQPAFDKGKPLMQALKDRKTSRDFIAKELPVEVLSGLLWAADGINRPDGKRTAPSASNCQEIDIYVAAKQGLYLYNAKENRIDLVIEKDLRQFAGIQEFVTVAPVVLVYVADFSRMKGNNADKIFYSAVDTGYISQNVYLFAAQEGLSTVVLGWVKKEELARAMGLKPGQQVILTQPVGYGE